MHSIIIVTIPDIPKDVGGHDAQEGELEEPDGDLDPAAADEHDTGWPVPVVDLGEKRRGSKLPEKSDIPSLTVFRPLHLSNLLWRRFDYKSMDESGSKEKFKA